jgi:hypothetical protein
MQVAHPNLGRNFSPEVEEIHLLKHLNTITFRTGESLVN